MKHGTATLGQFAEVSAAITRALPKALTGFDPKEIIRRVGNGEALERALHDALASLGDATPRAAEPAPIIPDLPTTFTVSGRDYELVSFVKKEDGGSVSGDTMVARATELGAELGEEDGRFLLEHQNEIPASLRGKIYMVFPKWRSPDGPRSVACLHWVGGEWCDDWGSLDFQWDGGGRLVRRRTV